jgi:hypothetical protein
MEAEQAKETTTDIEVEPETAVDEVVETAKTGYSPTITLSDEVPEEPGETVVEDAPEPVAATDEAIEIEVEEATKPVARRLSRTERRIKGKNAEIEEVTAEADALREQVKLYQLRDQQAGAIVEPDEDTFEGSDSEFKAAQRAWNQHEIERVAGEKAQEIMGQVVQNTTQERQAVATDEINRAHYGRADSLKVKNYDQLEGNAVDIIGDQFAQTLIASTENAHRILASMGANPAKTAQIASLIQSDPAKAFANALEFKIHPSLKSASTTVLDPETQVDPGRGVTKPERGPKGAKFW